MCLVNKMSTYVVTRSVCSFRNIPWGKKERKKRKERRIKNKKEADSLVINLRTKGWEATSFWHGSGRFVSLADEKAAAAAEVVSRKEKFFRPTRNRVCGAKGSYLRRCRSRPRTRRFSLTETLGAMPRSHRLSSKFILSLRFHLPSWRISLPFLRHLPSDLANFASNSTTYNRSDSNSIFKSRFRNCFPIWFNFRIF